MQLLIIPLILLTSVSQICTANDCVPNCNQCLGIGKCGLCAPKFYGESCSKTCDTCWDDGCDVTGYCFNCKPGFYTDSCDQACSDNCRPLESNKNVKNCERKTGKCQDGCIDTFWGERCDNKCSKACGRWSCFKEDGRCFECVPNSGKGCEENGECGASTCINATCFHLCSSCDAVKDGCTCDQDINGKVCLPANSSPVTEYSSCTRVSIIGLVAGLAVSVALISMMIIANVKQYKAFKPKLIMSSTATVMAITLAILIGIVFCKDGFSELHLAAEVVCCISFIVAVVCLIITCVMKHKTDNRHDKKSDVSLMENEPKEAGTNNDTQNRNPLSGSGIIDNVPPPDAAKKFHEQEAEKQKQEREKDDARNQRLQKPKTTHTDMKAAELPSVTKENTDDQNQAMKREDNADNGSDDSQLSSTDVPTASAEDKQNQHDQEDTMGETVDTTNEAKDENITEQKEDAEDEEGHTYKEYDDSSKKLLNSQNHGHGESGHELSANDDSLLQPRADDPEKAPLLPN